jgi:glycosyltransferase involved in cell wall biosynthesis
MVQKPELIIFSQFCMGGVYNLYEVLVNNDTEKSFDTKIILLNEKDQNHPKPYIDIKGTPFEIFDLDYNDHPAYYAKELEKRISNRPGVVVCNFLPELAALHIYKKKNKKLIFIIHDESYLDLAFKYFFLIDYFIVHNPGIYDDLLLKSPKFKNKTRYIPYGIHFPKQSKKEFQDQITCIFLARHVISKGIFEISKINQKLVEMKIPVKWKIFGDGKDSQRFKDSLRDFDNINFCKYEKKQDLFNHLRGADILIHPSTLDGLPVSILESMSVGVVPIVYRFNSGIEKVITKKCGIVVNLFDNQSIINGIAELHKNRGLLKKYSQNAIKLVREKYNIEKQAPLYFSFFNEVLQEKSKRKSFKFIFYYKGILYHPIIPKWLRILVQNLKNN